MFLDRLTSERRTKAGLFRPMQFVLLCVLFVVACQAAISASAAGSLCLGIVLSIVHRVLFAAGWGFSLWALGQRASMEYVARVGLVTNSIGWLVQRRPNAASRTSLAPTFRVTVAEASASKCIELYTLLCAAAVACLPALAWHGSGPLQSVARDLFLGMATLKLIGLGAICLVFGIVATGKLEGKLDSLRQRYRCLEGTRLSYGVLLIGISYYSALMVLQGLVVACLHSAVAATGTPVPLVVFVAVSAFSWAAGRIAVVVPRGLIIREAVFALALLPWMPFSLGLSLAILLRLVQTFAGWFCSEWVVLADQWSEQPRRNPQAPLETNLAKCSKRSTSI